MSDTTAFLAGSAVAGVAALLMLKSGGISLSQPEVPQPYAPAPSALVNTSAAAPPMMGPTPNPTPTDSATEALIRNQLDNNKSTTDQLKLQLEQQKFLTEQLKQQLEQQRDTTAQLKSQLDSQRQEATGVIDRLRDQQRSMDMLTLQQALPRNQDPSLLEQAQLLQTLQQNHTPTTNSAQIVTLWALGGILLILIMGGGVILVTVIVILMQQRKPAKPAPVVHHPITIPLSYGQLPYGQAPRRSPLLLPPPQVRRPPAVQPPNIPYNPYNPYNPYPPTTPPYENNAPNFYRDWEG